MEQNSRGFSLSASYPLKRSFARVGVTYGFDKSNVITRTDAAQSYFQYINFSGVAGPNSLEGIRTSHIVPSYTYNTVNHPISPTAGHSGSSSAGSCWSPPWPSPPSRSSPDRFSTRP